MNLAAITIEGVSGAPAWVNYILLSGMLAVAVGSLHHYLVKPIVHTAKKIDRWIDERETDHNELITVKEDITSIKYMVLPDSGNSLFDRAVKLQDSHEELRHQVGKLEKSNDEIEKKLDTLIERK